MTSVNAELFHREQDEARVDFRVVNHGSIMLVYPLTQETSDWFSEHVPDALYHGNALAVEPRYIHSLVIGMEEDGLIRG